jgi:transmembrane sensor
MYLSPGSRVDVLFVADERKLQLDAGEAMFKVHHDASRPFRVHSGSSVIQAVGTQFSVNRMRGDSVVSVVEGAVQISRDRSLVEKIVAPVTGSGSADVKAVRLTAGQETRIGGGGEVATPKRTDVDPMKDWKDRRLTFINETLFAMAEEFNRYNRTKIRVEDAAAGERRYAAAFDADDLESLVAVLQSDSTLQIEKRNDEIVVSSR